MSLFNKNFGPIVLKESHSASEYIEKLKNLATNANESLKKEIEKQIIFIQKGIDGEANTLFQLRYAGMDMYILHDLYLKYGDISAQIDFIIVTRKRTYILECKNFSGNIEVNNRGAFIRKYDVYGGKENIEGTESPITQNERHLQVIKDLKKESKGNFISKKIFEANFADNYKSIVVFTNPKTVINDKYAKREIKKQIVRVDQLINRIKELDAEVKNSEMSDKQMRTIAEFFITRDKTDRTDYIKKYEELLKKSQMNDTSTDEFEVERVAKIEDATERENELTLKLKAFRKEQSISEQITAYYIFTDAQMEGLIDRKPRNKDELLEVAGFGDKKVEKYGDAIIRIIGECFESQINVEEASLQRNYPNLEDISQKEYIEQKDKDLMQLYESKQVFLDLDNVIKIDSAKGDLHIYQDKADYKKNYLGKKVEHNGVKMIQRMSDAMDLDSAHAKLKKHLHKDRVRVLQQGMKQPEMEEEMEL